MGERKGAGHKPNYVIVIPPINRQLLDLLFSLVYMMDDLIRARWLTTGRVGAI
ncbi:hypothetical protein [Edaphobacter modestus]|uniref:Uncharacterized protein n=1 Tax=Edaphobacter modestus TaxID=388466 RepID=A0A4Q7YNW6_9BACT|nr:hypothetical protein [Edaphobacter modestus]RZU39110.1 hypothetical protein BDD14_0442 [Edaphobacter modestus]